MRAATDGHRRLRIAARLAVALVALIALALAASPGPDTDTSQPEGVRFSVRCAETGEGPRGVTCALVVSGLPDPLDHEVSVVLFSGHEVPATPHGSAAVDSVVASEAPAITPDVPALVSSHLPLPPPSPISTSLRVPAPPPRSL